MGIRQRAYWLHQAGAVKRQLIAATAIGVRIGMAESPNYKKAMEDLGIGEPQEQSSKATWDMLFFLKGGTGV